LQFFLVDIRKKIPNSFRCAIIFYLNQDGLTKTIAANMRAKPSAKSTKVGALKAKDRVRIISKSKDLNDPKRMKDLWFKVETEDGKQGWISGSLLAKAKLVPAAMGGAPEMMPSGDSGGASAPAMAPSAPADSEAPAAPSATKPSSSDEIPDIEILDSTDETK
jgi:hypothetical protein